jgi:hypothetical protein
MITEILGAVAGVSGVGQSFTKGVTMALPPSGSSVQATTSSARMEAQFQNAVSNAGLNASSTSGPSQVMQSMFNALDQVNGQARSVSDYANKAEADGGSLTPGEIVQLTMRCNEFMFQCQLTSNIANRSSDGIQQLFRQQG